MATTLYHPHIPDNFKEVDDALVADHLTQGWLKSPPKNAAVEAAREAAEQAAKP